MSSELWLAFCLTEGVLCFTPGPAVLLVVSTALGGGLRPSLTTAVGILAANTLYFGLSATGIAAVLIASRDLFLAIKWLGAIYLVGLGLRMLFAPAKAGERVHVNSAAGSFWRGFLVQGANPKALVFFLALLPQFIDPNGSAALQIVVLGASSVAIELLALSLYACCSVRARTFAGPRLEFALERVGGGVLVGAGARLAALRSD